MPISAIHTTGAPAFDPHKIFDDSSLLEEVHAHLRTNDLASAIQKAFTIPSSDRYTYHATASVTLSQAQQAVSAGPAHGLHDWYLDDEKKPRSHPDIAEVAAYVLLFDPSKVAANTLKGFKSNAKKGSIRAGVAEYLTSKRYVDSSILIPRRKKPHSNPYIDFWAWSCHSLEYAGPDKNTVDVRLSHHVLPIFMHHFSCACPSYESLEVLKQVSRGMTILDIGSGNGYWTFMLRRQDCKVIPVDNGQSKWRTCWIADTIVTDGVQFVKRRGNDEAKSDVLLMVYPIVSADFTKKVIKAYRGDTIAIVGTQNGNGYTGFKDLTADEWMREENADFKKIVQVPLPSFPGKDDALFVFRRVDSNLEET